MTDADLARWEGEASGDAVWMMEVRVVRALIAEVRRLRAALRAIQAQVEAARVEWLARDPEHGVVESPVLARIAETLDA